MKIALYYPWIYLTSGVERTILDFVKRSSHDVTIFTNHFDKKNTYPEFASLNIRELRKIPVKRDIFSVLKSALLISTQKLPLSGFDCLLVHSDGLGDLILILNRKLPVFCYCHTPLRPVFDIYYKERVYELKNIFEKSIHTFLAFFFKIIDKFLWQKFIHVYFNSNETLNRARRGGLLDGFSTDRISVLHPGVDLEKIQPSWEYEPYFFLPGRIMWTKNIEFAIKAFVIFKNKQLKSKHFKLVIAGQVDEKSKTYFNKLKTLSATEKVIRFVANPADSVMHKFYRNCWAVLSASFNEDWGLTLIEGNAFGKPVVAVRRGGFAESQKDGVTGYMVHEDMKSFSNAIFKLANNKKLLKKMGKNAYLNSKKYNIANFVRKLDQSTAAALRKDH